MIGCLSGPGKTLSSNPDRTDFVSKVSTTSAVPLAICSHNGMPTWGVVRAYQLSLAVLLGTILALQLPFSIAAEVQYVLNADDNGWTIGDAGETNPLLTAVAGDIVGVTILWVDVGANFAIYPPEYPRYRVYYRNPDALFRTEDISPSYRSASLTFRLDTPGHYGYFSEWRPGSMAGRLTILSQSPVPFVSEIRVISPAPLIATQPARFVATAVGHRPEALAYVWDFGDGSTMSGITDLGGGEITTWHPYEEEGTYAASLTVDDGDGGRASVVTPVDVVLPGLLRVRTQPPSLATIFVDGIRRDDWGLDWMKIAPGPHVVSFGPGPYGYALPPETSVVVRAGEVTEVIGEYRPQGILRVTTNPPVPSSISVDHIPRNTWGLWMAVPPAEYRISFGPVQGFDPPAAQRVAVAPGESVHVVGSFLQNQSAPGPNLKKSGPLVVAADPYSDDCVRVSAQIVIDGIPRDERRVFLWLPFGTYNVSFTDVYGCSTPPPRQVTLDPDAWDEPVEVFEQYAHERSLDVIVSPTLPATIFVDDVPRNDWGFNTAFPSGCYTISFGSVPGYQTPPPVVHAVELSLTQETVGGTYEPITGNLRGSQAFNQIQSDGSAALAWTLNDCRAHFASFDAGSTDVGVEPSSGPEPGRSEPSMLTERGFEPQRIRSPEAPVACIAGPVSVSFPLHRAMRVRIIPSASTVCEKR